MTLDEALRIIRYARMSNMRQYQQAAQMLATITEAARDYVRATGNDVPITYGFLVDMVETVDL